MLKITSEEYRYKLSAAKDATERAELTRKIATGQIVLSDAETPRRAPETLDEFRQQSEGKKETYVDTFDFSLGDRADFLRKVDRASPHLRAGMIKTFDDLVKQHQK